MKLYEFLQTGLQTTEIYQNLISMEASYNLLLAGNFNQLPTYTPSDPDGEFRKSFLRKIMARYYNYELFTEDSLYFAVRMFWKLNQIMPTYASKFNAMVSPGEFEAIFSEGVKTVVEAHKSGTDASQSDSTGGSKNTTSRTSDATSTSKGTVKNDGNTVQFNSDYPQVLIGSSTDYNSTGARANSNATQTNDLTDTSNVTDTSEHEYEQDLKTRREGENTEDRNETRTRGLSPYEIMLAKEKINKLVMNIEEEIVLAVSDLFMNVGWDDYDCDYKHKRKVEEACKQLLVFAITLNNLNNRINELNFTPEQIANINDVPALQNTTEFLKTEVADLQKSVGELAGQLLPDISPQDVGKILMVTAQGTWGAILLPNWATEGF